MTLPVPISGDSISLEELDAWLRETVNRTTGRPLADSLIAPVAEFLAAAVKAYAHNAHPAEINADALRFPADQLEDARSAIERGFVDSLFIEAYPTADIMQRICDPLTTGILRYAVTASNARGLRFVIQPDLDLDTVRLVTPPVHERSSWTDVCEHAEPQHGAYAYSGYQRLFFSHNSVVDPRGPHDLESSAFRQSTSDPLGKMLSPLEWLSVVAIRPHLPAYVITGANEWLRGVSVDGALVGGQAFWGNNLRVTAPDDYLDCHGHRIAIG
jgi:hypothetical protein